MTAYKYRPVQEEMAEVSEWLTTLEGHMWLDEHLDTAQRLVGGCSYGPGSHPWISIKFDEFETGEDGRVRRTAVEDCEMMWYPRGGEYVLEETEPWVLATSPPGPYHPGA